MHTCALLVYHPKSQCQKKKEKKIPLSVGRLHGVWGDVNVSSITFVGIISLSHKDADSNRPTEKV